MPNLDQVDPRICSPVHRIILLDATNSNVCGKLVDNVHEFSVMLTHDRERVVSIMPGAQRVPWTTCPAALPRINVLIGAKLTEGLSKASDKTLNCTHLYDLTRLAMAHAARARTQLRYDLHVETDMEGGTINAVALRNGAVALQWDVLEDRIVSPGPFSGCMTTNPSQWPLGVSEDDLETALLLRRAMLVFRGRGLSATAKRAADMPYMAGVCHSFQPEPMAEAIRPIDFVDYPANSVPKFFG